MNKVYINVIQHLAFEDLGSFANVFKASDYQIRYFHAGVNVPAEIYQDTAILVVLGGPIGVYETDVYPYLQDEIAGLKYRIEHDLATLGICLGAQLLAAAAGANVYPGQVKEIGFSDLILTEAGLASPLKYLEEVAVLHWHGDTFDLPENAQHLASSVHYPHQAFSMGQHILALQFHPEADPARFEQWLIGHTCELNKANIDIVGLRAHNSHYGQLLPKAAEQMLKAWLGQIALS